MTDSYSEMTITDAAALLQSRKISPVELTAQALERIAQLNPRLTAFLTVTEDLAKEQARAAETEIMAGHYRGPLHGVPVAVKDLFYTRGIRTTAGSKILPILCPTSIPRPLRYCARRARFCSARPPCTSSLTA